MNGDVATRAATRREDRPAFAIAPEGHKYCWRCSTYKPQDEIRFGGRCWDCTHATSRKHGARVAVEFIRKGQTGAALLALAIAVDDQARAEGIMLRDHQTVTRHAHRRLLSVALQRADRVIPAVRPTLRGFVVVGRSGLVRR